MTRAGDAVRTRLERRYPKEPRAERLVADGRVWRKVAKAEPWRPSEVGNVLVGELVGRSTRPGDNGTVYGVVTLRTAEGARTVSGVVITSLFEAAAVPDGTLVRVVFKGRHVSGAGRHYNDYDLFVAEEKAR